ncbi:Cro/C1-type HTH DNA-binding domain-containing protein [Pedobacter steynii]|uniref:Cro/C1-type HTH DNA-binding domain-containing protein n=1 Tax=Pedobacter steynii TaxID=430522 RepID=A0A1H0GIL1_9SPHI|nr:helix-turn-helix transcriptional regulator [Pedobacter steynii]NQX42429.1 helix-turn-helix transcriptional regulator [Pedobacter steynii]SDO06599.1 Cro/C1-type HTH DNA-binding domain-containing protein [Pedobacter steynii]
MTKLGYYLGQRSVNKSEVARKTGLTKARMNELTLRETSKLRAEELYLIALAINVKPTEMLEEMYHDLTLIEEG